MRYEKSCGAVVFHDTDTQRLYLVEHMLLGHTALCKGHVEGEETEYETAQREILEETGLHVSFVPGFRTLACYSPAEGVQKEVVYFLARADSIETTPQPEEVSSLEFLPLEEALKAMTYEDDRGILRDADKYLRSYTRSLGQS
ncbi:MAG: NUDIX domain-containing protein [Clostridia bacterium]|nr:NUDIX domain-containing protein [Clostridia bacterium]